MDRKLLRCLPEVVADALRRAAALYGETVDEIRMYRDGCIVLVVGGRNIKTSVVCTEKILQETIGNLCGHSLYAHEESLRQGFIFTRDGIRVGVAGRCVCSGDGIERVADPASLCIRIPRRFPGTVDDILPYVADGGIPRSVLIFSPPGVGKTTALRELADQLANTPYRVALIDTRYELGYGLSGEFLDVFKGYPRPIGMETATRVMNPQFVICDEISTEGDARAVLQCASSGVAVIASAHGGSPDDLCRQAALNSLFRHGVFRTLVQLHRRDGQLVHTFYCDRGGVLIRADGRDNSVNYGRHGGCDPFADG